MIVAVIFCATIVYSETSSDRDCHCCSDWKWMLSFDASHTVLAFRYHFGIRAGFQLLWI